MAMKPPPPRRRRRSTPALPDEMIHETLLRVPADDPASLVRSAAGCWSWRHMISHTDFATAYRNLRGVPPMLGILYGRRYTDDEPPCHRTRKSWISRFLPTATFPPLAAQAWKHWKVLDSRHGLVLFYTPRVDDDFVVCDLVTGEQWVIRADPKCHDIMWPSYLQDFLDETESISCNAAVLCAKDGCGHRDCHGGPFLVVLLGSHTTIGNPSTNHATVYSSVTREWSDVTSVVQHNVIDSCGQSAVVGNNVYVPCVEDDSVVVYNICENELSAIAMPLVDESQPYIDLMGVEDGMLLFASVVKPRLYLWWMEAGPRGAAGWARRRVIELGQLLPLPVLEDNSDVSPVGYVEGVGVIFINTRIGLYKMELSSQQGGQVHEVYTHKVMPYMSFYTGVWKSLSAPDEASHAVADATTT